MPRRPRVVIPGVAHHVTQRGNNRQPVFFCSDDRLHYLDLLARHSRNHRVRILGYCLMTNHVHLIAIPETENGLARVVGRSHAEYALAWNKAEMRTGHLWHNRYYSCPLDNTHLIAALRYVELNPVRAGLAIRAWEWPWSSAGVHADPQTSDPLITEPWSEPLERWNPEAWREALQAPASEADCDALRRATSSGEPLGPDEFVRDLEWKTGRPLAVRKSGRPRKPFHRVTRLHLTST
jgi:putative transposase